MDIDVIFTFILVFSVGSCARYTTKINFQPMRHISILFFMVLVFSSAYTLIDQNPPYLETIWRASGDAIISILSFFFFRYLVLKFE